jgi:hypothetical protein
MPAPAVVSVVDDLVADDDAFASLVNDVLENPDLLLDDKLTADQVLEIQKRLNPYAGIAGAGADRAAPDHTLDPGYPEGRYLTNLTYRITPE